MSLIAHVGATSNNATSITTAPITTTGAGLIVIHASWVAPSGFLSDLPSISDNNGNVYTALTAVSPVYAFGLGSRLYYCLLPLVGSGHTFTGAMPNTGEALGLQVQAFSGTFTFSSQNGFSSGVSGVPSAQPGSVTPSVNNSVIVAGGGYAENYPWPAATINQGFTFSDSFVLPANQPGPQACAYLIQSSAAAVNPTWTFVSTANVALTIAVFSPTGGGTPIAEPVNPACTFGFNAAFTVGGGPPFGERLNPAASIGWGFGYLVSGGPDRASSTTAATIGWNLGFSIAASHAPVLDPAATLGISLGFSVGTGNITFPLAFGATMGADLEFGNYLRLNCPTSTASVGTSYSSAAVAVGGGPPYTYSLVLGVVIPPNLNIVCLGDDMTTGSFPSGITGWPSQLGTILGTTCTNLSTSGGTMATLLNPGGQVDLAIAAYIGGQDNIALVLIGVNDLGNGTSLSTVQINYAMAVSRLRAKGYYVIAATMTPSNYTSFVNYPIYISQILALNAWLLAGGSGAQQVCDFGGIPQLQTPSDTTYFYTDQLHLITAGLALEAAAMANTITDPLANGLALAYQTGIVQGIPQDLGTYPYTIMVTDANGSTATATCAITVQSPTPPWPPASCMLVPAPSYTILLALTPLPEEQDGS